ncbi:hypothetical protein HUO13_18940 [Saccharopolyspora erythraea]|uniref:hypothetical protein n=1 Tax=Saccharopolyspora erythraea TaxID=1836 RepID=UPI001BA90861|nr:hypothetical protein [Saccharopolyspora erythraea]QUH02601.1 hypothetical protein HUO13_18940 [Saccharopolyspora erythraea]
MSRVDRGTALISAFDDSAPRSTDTGRIMAITPRRPAAAAKLKVIIGEERNTT